MNALGRAGQGLHLRRVGTVTLVLGLLVGIGVVTLGRHTLGARTYTAQLSQTAGLRVGEAVDVAGIEVGRVTALRLQGPHVLATFTVDRDIRLGNRTTAEVRVATLLGTHYLQVKPDGAGPLENAQIPLARTSVPYNLQDAIDAGTKKVAALDVAELSRALSAITGVLKTAGPHVGPALRGVRRMSEMISRNSDEYDALLKASTGVTDQLSGSSSDLVTLLKSSHQILAELNSRRQTIDALLKNVQSLANTVSALVKENRASLGPVLRDLRTVITVLRERRRDLALALHRYAVTSRYLANTTGNGPWMDAWAPDSQMDSAYCLTAKDCQ